MAIPRHRARNGSRGGRWLALGGIALVVLVFTFAVGVLVGRQAARHPDTTQAAEPARKNAPARRSGLVEPVTERSSVQEKLTFYQTLTAPLGTVSASTKPDALGKTQAAAPGLSSERQASPADRAASPSNAASRPSSGRPMPSGERPPSVAGPTTPVRPSFERPPAPTDRGATIAATAPTSHPAERAPASADRGPATPTTATAADRSDAASAGAQSSPRAPESRSGDWAVQVGAFRDREQAESVRKPLAGAGLDAYLTAVPTEDGQMRYKVRVGTFKTREEAARMAERLRQERSLSSFVTPR